MPFEHHVQTYLEWLFGSPTEFHFLDPSSWRHIGFFFGAILILFLISIGAPFIWFLLAAVKHGPGEGFYIVTKAIYEGLTVDLPRFSLRRTLAVATVAVQEAIRNKVLIAFAVFLVLLLFAGLFLDVENSNPARTYLSLVLTTTTYLVILMSLLLSAFSLPTDIKNRTIYTVVTKPIRAGEIVLGRVAGFMAVGTVMLAAMCLISYVFVVRGLSHSHVIDAADIVPARSPTALPGTKEGVTSNDHHHLHRFEIDSEGRVADTANSAGHFHGVEAVQEGTRTVYRVGPNRGDLVARSPVFGKLTMYNNNGEPVREGVNVGMEWTYRSYVEGGNNQAAAVWTFSNITPERYGDGLPLELNLSVFRTYKGNIERGVLGEIIIRNPDPEANVKASGPIIFESREFEAHRIPIPRELPAAATGAGEKRTIDLFKDLTYKGQVEVVIRCRDRSQYFGVAQADVYLRPRDSSFALNFAKGFFSVWLQMLLVTGFGVMFSTFLSGPVAALGTIGAVVLGFFGQFVRDVSSGVAAGGGPIESLIRILLQQNVMTDLETSQWVAIAVKAFDTAFMGILHGLTYILPDYRQFDTSQFVASGYNIYGDLVAQHVTAALVYFLSVSVFGYFFLKTREIAG